MATARAGQLSSRWKTVNARRQADLEGMDPDEAAPEEEGTLRAAANEAVDAFRQNVGGAIEDAAGRAGQVMRGMMNQARGAMARDPYPITEPAEGEARGVRFADPDFEEPTFADPATTGLELEPGAIGNVTRVGQMLRGIRGAGEAPTGSTSFGMGDAINEARGAAGS